MWEHHRSSSRAHLLGAEDDVSALWPPALGCHSSLCFQLFVHEGNRSSMNYCSFITIFREDYLNEVLDCTVLYIHDQL